MKFILDSMKWERRKKDISEQFGKYWTTTVKQQIKEKWKPVKTSKPSAPGKPFRVHSAGSPAKIVEVKKTAEGFRVAYKQGKNPSNWAKRMEFGGECLVTIGQLLK